MLLCHDQSVSMHAITVHTLSNQNNSKRKLKKVSTYSSSGVLHRSKKIWEGQCTTVPKHVLIKTLKCHKSHSIFWQYTCT